jgi:hypothetical protein
MSYNSRFKVGDVVIKNSGKKPFEIVSQPYSQYSPLAARAASYCGRYLHNGSLVYAKENSIKIYEQDQQEMTTKTLYSYKEESGKVVFATYLATNSENKYILEVKGTGEIVVKDPKELEEVLPYTFSVKVSGKELHYIGERGKLKKGDWLIMDTGNRGYEIVTVEAIDTKNKTARSKFKGRKITTEEI